MVVEASIKLDKNGIIKLSKLDLDSNIVEKTSKCNIVTRVISEKYESFAFIDFCLCCTKKQFRIRN